jgi:hypothetical protein
LTRRPSDVSHIRLAREPTSLWLRQRRRSAGEDGRQPR